MPSTYTIVGIVSDVGVKVHDARQGNLRTFGGIRPDLDRPPTAKRDSTGSRVVRDKQTHGNQISFIGYCDIAICIQLLIHIGDAIRIVVVIIDANKRSGRFLGRFR